MLTLADILKLAHAEQSGWAAHLATIRATGVPTNDGDAGGTGGSGGDDGGTGDAGGTGDDTGAKDDTGKTPASGDAEARAEAAQRAAAAANAEMRRMKAERQAEKDAADKEAGRWKEIAERKTAELDSHKAETETARKTGLVTAALTSLSARNPALAAKSIDTDKIDDEASALRAAKALQTTDPYLFEEKKTRQVRTQATGGDDDADTDKTKPRTRMTGSSRLRRGLAAEN